VATLAAGAGTAAAAATPIGCDADMAGGSSAALKGESSSEPEAGLSITAAAAGAVRCPRAAFFLNITGCGAGGSSWL
jgi:hypothetical protein